MPRDHYPLMMCLLVGSAVLGLAVKYQIIYLFHIVAGFIVLRSLRHAHAGTLFCRFRPPSSYHHFFGFLGIWFALGLIWSWDRDYTLAYLGYITCGGMLAVSVLKYVGGSLGRFENLFAVAKWLFLADIGAGLLEAFTPFRLPVSPMVEGGKVAMAHEHSADGLHYVMTMPTGFHWNPNNFAAVMLMLLPFFLFHKKWFVKLGGLAAVDAHRLRRLARMHCGDGGHAPSGDAVRPQADPIHRRRRGGGDFLDLARGFFANPDHVQNPKLRKALTTVSALSRYLSPDSDESSDTNSVGVRRQLISNGLDPLHESYGLGVGGGADRYVQKQFRWSSPTSPRCTTFGSNCSSAAVTSFSWSWRLVRPTGLRAFPLEPAAGSRRPHGIPRRFAVAIARRLSSRRDVGEHRHLRADVHDVRPERGDR